MVVFVTLFMGLMTGPRPVEVAVADPVAAVEIYLDGRRAACLDGPPWRTEADFGAVLAPRRVEARAFDAAGRALAAVHRLVNTSRSEYGAVIVLDPRQVGDPPGGPRAGRVRWQAVLGREPVRLAAELDGRALAVAPNGRFRLPPHDPAAPHVVAAELTFEDGSVVSTEVAFGGLHGDRVTSALTALPITSPPGRPWIVEQVGGWLERDGTPLTVFTAGAETGVLLILRDERMQAELRLLRKLLFRRPPQALARAQVPAFRTILIAPRPVAEHPGTFKLVPLAPSSLRYGLMPLLLSERPLVDVEKRRSPRSAPQKLWDSLAVAGLNAAVTNRPRAVLLAVGSDPKDESFLAWRQAKHYLERLRVPLFVWASNEDVLAGLGLEETERTSSGRAGLMPLADRIEAELDSQTIVWVEGEHLPGEIELSPAAPAGVELLR